MNQKNMAMKIWNIVYPILYYYAVVLITLTIAQWIIGTDDAHYVVCQLIATVVAIPAVLPFYRQDQALRGIAAGMPKVEKEHIVNSLWAVIIVACISIAGNNIISMTPLVEMSAGYQKANAGFYGSTLALELISSGIATPVLEELVFRGITYGRLRNLCSKTVAILLSALIFALVHFNIVQLVYAFLIGIVLAMLMEQAGHMYVAVVGHMTANIIAVIRTETGFLDWSVNKSGAAWVFSVILLLVGIGVLCFKTMSGNRDKCATE